MNANVEDFFSICPSKGVIICIDYGQRKTGIAICDPDMRVSLPYSVLESMETENLLNKIIKISHQYNAISFVVGLPLNLDGTKSLQTNLVENFAYKLSEISDLPIFFYDERFTSKVADTMLKDLNLSRKQRNSIDDKVSAHVILEGFLTRISKIRQI